MRWREDEDDDDSRRQEKRIEVKIQQARRCSTNPKGGFGNQRSKPVTNLQGTSAPEIKTFSDPLVLQMQLRLLQSSLL